MLIRASGGKSGIKEYLEDGQKQDRYYSRDELDQRLVLNGDLDIVDNVINSIDISESERDRYFHFTLAFKEDSISEQMLHDISDEFRQFYYKAYGDEEVYYYAEAHLPKIKSYTDAKTGDAIVRKPHIHVVVPTINTLTGESLNLNVSATIDHMDAFQEYINEKYGLESPKDNPRYRVNDNSEFISRYKGDGFKGKHRELREQIFDQVLGNNISSFTRLQNYLEDNGYSTKIRNAGKGVEHEYINIVDKSGMSVNLRDKVFRHEFLSLDTELKISNLKSEIKYFEPSNKNNNIGESNGSGIVRQHRTNGPTVAEQADIGTVDENIRTAYTSLENIGSNLERHRLDKGSAIGGARRRGIANSYARIAARSENSVGRDFGEYEPNKYSPGSGSQNAGDNARVDYELLAVALDNKYVDLLREWDNYKAYEYKYVTAMASKQERSKFNKLSAIEKNEYIQKKQIEFYKKHGVDNGVSIDSGEYRELGSINLEQADIGTVDQNIRAADDALEGIRVNLGRSQSDKASFVGRERRWQIATRYARIIGRSEAGVGQNTKQYKSHEQGAGSIGEENRPVRNLIENEYKLLLTKLDLSRADYKALVVKYNSEIQANVLLELLEKSHGVNPELYRVTRAFDGSDRIGCGSRNLNMMDFCLKEMNHTLEKSNNVLANAYGMQLEVNRERGWSRDSTVYLSDKYKVWFAAYKADRASSMLKHTDDFKLKREGIIARVAEKIAEVRADSKSPYHAKREQINILKIDKLLELEALKQSKYAANVSIKNKYNLEMQKAYRVFLCELARDNDEKALLELRRLRIDYKDVANADSFNYVDRYQEYKLNITYVIDTSGTINYQHNGKTIIQDHGKRVSIVQHTDDNVKLTLDLAIQKFGLNIWLTGSDKFRQRAVDMAIKNNYKVNFLDEFSKKYYQQKLSELRIGSDKLAVAKVDLVNDKPKLLYVKGIGEHSVINANGRVSTMNTVQLLDPVTSKSYEVSSYKINFLAKTLVSGQFVEVVPDNAGDISLRSSNIEKEIRKLKAVTIAAARETFIDKVKVDYGVKELMDEYSGKLIKTGATKGAFYALVASGGEVKRVYGNDLKNKLDELKVKTGDTVSIAVPVTRLAEVNKTENIVSIARADKVFQDLLLEVDLSNGRASYKKEYFGRVMEIKPVQLRSGTKTNVVSINDILSGRQQTLYMDNVADLKANDFAHLGEKSFNSYEITRLNDRLQARREKILGEQNTKDVSIGEISKVGLKTIKGNEVYYVELRTDTGIVTKYGNKIRQEIEQSGLQTGDGIIITNQEQILTVTKEENVLEVKHLDKDVDDLVETVIEKALDKIELKQKSQSTIRTDFEIS